MFIEDLAELNKEMVGQKYRPSNGTEGEMFMEMFCYNCKHDGEYKQCDLIALSMVFNVEDDKYPKEWQYREDGQPLCTKFEKEGK